MSSKKKCSKNTYIVVKSQANTKKVDLILLNAGCLEVKQQILILLSFVFCLGLSCLNPRSTTLETSI